MRPRIHLHILASGSKGNAAVVEGPDGSVLVDCGLSRRELHRRADLIDCDLGRVKAILLTHEHGDHTKGIPVVCKHFDGPTFATAGTISARKGLCDLGITPLQRTGTIEVGGMHIQAFPLSHDVFDPICFRFEVREGGTLVDAVAWATDTGVLTKQARSNLAGCRILGIEANHDPRMLAEGPYPYYLKARVGGSVGHLSNTQAAEALPHLVGPETTTVVAMHLSENNNLPKLARAALVGAVGPQVEVVIASQTKPMTIL